MKAIRLALASALACSWMVSSPGPAGACSCAPLMVRDALRQADAAVVGTVARQDAGGPAVFGAPSSVFTIAVEEAVKGDFGAEVEVSSPSDGSSCGLGLQDGERVGLLLRADGDHWTSSMCEEADPDALLAAAEPLPAPDGQGPIRFVTGGNFGEARLLGLDAKGRTLVYGWGEGTTYDVQLCPGGRRLVETYSLQDEGRVAVRDVASLRVVRDVRVVGSRFPAIDHVACLDRAGSQIVAVDGSGPDIRILSVDGGNVRAVYEAPGSATSSTISGGVPYVMPRGGELSEIDVGTGAATPVLPGVPLPGSSAVSPDGRWVAVLRARHEDGVSTLEVVSTADGSIHRLRFDRRYRWARLSWADPATVFFDSSGRLFVVSVPQMRVLGEGGRWWAIDPVLEGDRVTGVSGGELQTIGLGGDGSVTAIPILEGEAYALVGIPGDVAAEPGASPGAPHLGPGATLTPSAGGRAATGMLLALLAFGGVVLLIVVARRKRPVDSGQPLR